MKLLNIVNRKADFKAGDKTSLSNSLSFIENELKQIGVSRKLILQTLMLAEEMLVLFLQKADPESSVHIKVRKFLGDASVIIRAEGAEINLLDTSVGNIVEVEEDDEDTELAIRSILLKARKDDFRYANRAGVNEVQILTGENRQSTMRKTFAALLIGLVFGAVMRFVLPASLSEGITYYALNPLKTIFMNALKIIIGPVIFFSISSCISQFQDLRELGRIGAKIISMYMFTTVIAVVMALVLFLIIRPGTFGFALGQSAAAAAVEVDTNVDTSVLSMLVNIVPDNFVKPFADSNTLQIIFLGLLCGATVGMIGRYSKVLQELFEAFNSMFLTITSIITRFIPVAVFCSIAVMINEMGGKSLVEVLSAAGTIFLADAIMLAIYALLVWIFAGVDPVTFFRKGKEGMLTSFTLSSSNAAMPANMKVCTENFGISPKICSFSIPLGATINMDGSCICFVIIGLFLARAYAVTVPSSTLFSLCIAIILLSLGCPGIPGAGIVCYAVVLEHIGVPVSAIGLVIGLTPFLDMTTTMSNTTGDLAATLIVAKSEHLIDEEILHS